MRKLKKARALSVKSTSTKKGNTRIFYSGSGRYSVVGKTKASVMTKATRVDKSPGMSLSRPSIKKVVFKNYPK